MITGCCGWFASKGQTWAIRLQSNIMISTPLLYLFKGNNHRSSVTALSWVSRDYAPSSCATRVGLPEVVWATLGPIQKWAVVRGAVSIVAVSYIYRKRCQSNSHCIFFFTNLPRSADVQTLPALRTAAGQSKVSPESQQLARSSNCRSPGSAQAPERTNLEQHLFPSLRAYGCVLGQSSDPTKKSGVVDPFRISIVAFFESYFPPRPLHGQGRGWCRWKSRPLRSPREGRKSGRQFHSKTPSF